MKKVTWTVYEPNIRRTPALLKAEDSLHSGSRTEAPYLRYRLVEQATMILRQKNEIKPGKKFAPLFVAHNRKTGQYSGFFI